MKATANKAKPAGRMEEILSAAAQIFFAKGYHATTIEDVARNVGMLKGSLYYYIDSKEDLLYQLLTDTMKQAEEYVRQRALGAKDTEETLRRALEAHIEYIIENRVRVGLFLHEFDSLSGRRQGRVREQMHRYQSFFRDCVRQGQREGIFLGGDPWLLVNGILGMGNWIYRWYHGEHVPDLETVKTTFVSIIEKGILRREGGRS